MSLSKNIDTKTSSKHEARRESEAFFNRLFGQSKKHPAKSLECSHPDCAGWSSWTSRKRDRSIHSNYTYRYWYEVCHHRQRRLFESHRDIMTARDIKRAEKLVYDRDLSCQRILSMFAFERRRNPPPGYTENASDRHISAGEHEALMKEVESLQAQISSLKDTLTHLR